MRVQYLCGLALALVEPTFGYDHKRQYITGNPDASQGAIATGFRDSSSSSHADHTTCCYVSAGGVGINTWYSSAIEVTVATVITTWIHVNNTLTLANSTTIRGANATSLYGTFGFGTVASVSALTTSLFTTTASSCDSGINKTCVATNAGPLTETTILSTTFDSIPTVVPTDLLPSRASFYGKSVIGENAVTIPDQGNLVIHSPTPFLQFREIYLATNWPCPTQTTMTSATEFIPITKSGTRAWETTVYPTLVTSAFPDSRDPRQAQEYNLILNKIGIVEVFPPGDYSNFSYSAWVVKNGGMGGGEWGGDILSIGPQFPIFLAGIPAVRSQVPGIQSCTNLAGGDGQPTVHVPVSEVTATVHFTLQLPGATPSTPSGLTTADATGSSQTTEPEITSVSRPIGVPDSVTPSTAMPSVTTPGTIETPTTAPTVKVGPSEPNRVSFPNTPGSQTPTQSKHSATLGIETLASQSVSTMNIGRIIASIIGITTGLTPGSLTGQPGSGTKPTSTSLEDLTGRSSLVQATGLPPLVDSVTFSQTVKPGNEYTGVSTPSIVSGQQTMSVSSGDITLSTPPTSTYDLLSAPEVTGQTTPAMETVTETVSSVGVLGSSTFTSNYLVTTAILVNGSFAHSTASKTALSTNAASGISPQLKPDLIMGSVLIVGLTGCLLL